MKSNYFPRVLSAIGALLSQIADTTFSSRKAVMLPAAAEDSHKQKVTKDAYGYLDSITDEVIRGWAFEPNSPSSPLWVEIGSDTGQSAVVLAKVWRRDLFDAGLGEGLHAFAHRLGWEWRTAKVIWARIVGSKVDLINSPMSLQAKTRLFYPAAAAPSQPAVAPFQPTAAPSQPAATANSADHVLAEDDRTAIGFLYKLALARTASPDEIDIWANNIAQGLSVSRCVQLIATSDEAKMREAARRISPHLNDAEFVMGIYVKLLRRGPNAFEVDLWRDRIESNAVTRDELACGFTSQILSEDEVIAQNDASITNLLGTTTNLSIQDWLAAKEGMERARPEADVRTFPACFSIKKSAQVKVSAIASLFKGKQYIETFLNNITKQSIFQDYAELIIIDANSPEHEADDIFRAMKQYPNIRYHRCETTIGIYEAWNLGISLARGEYITNTNLDDIRALNSLEVQSSVLDNLSYVDVVYQDVYYYFEENLDFDTVARMGFTSDVPPISKYNLLAFNSPHNGPMWRRSLHDDVGLFDTSYRSAGDYEFWIRCVSAGKTFYKVPIPTVGYYVNPHGISTSANTLGVEEAKRITREYSPQIISSSLRTQSLEFEKMLGAYVPLRTSGLSRYETVQNAIFNARFGKVSTPLSVSRAEDLSASRIGWM